MTFLIVAAKMVSAVVLFGKQKKKEQNLQHLHVSAIESIMHVQKPRKTMFLN